MSGVHPTPRDKLERDYLALAKRRSDLVAPLDAQLLEMQRKLEKIESPRGSYNSHSLQFIKLNQDPSVLIMPELAEDRCSEFHVEQSPMVPDPDAPAPLRLIALLTGILHRVTQEPTRPKLEAYAALLALGSPCYSMRTIARLERVTPNAVSLRTKAIQREFNLPKNHHNGHGSADWAPPQ